MIPFSIKPTIIMYDTFATFAEKFQICSSDIIIINEFNYARCVKQLDLECGVLFPQHYGTGEPSNVMVDNIMAEVGKRDFKRVIGVGGGTVIDVAKLLVLGGTGNTADYFDRRVPLEKVKELVLVPTTCGTGSEVTNITIMEIKEQKTKKGLAADELFADYAVLIPELLTSLPYKVFATSSIDALVHAMESFVAPNSNAFTELFSTKAIEIIICGYQKIVADGPQARTELMKDFLFASTYAGIAFGNTGVGAVHALSYPLGGKYHVPHGEANQQMFTTVFKEYKKVQPHGKIEQLEKQVAILLNAEIQNVWVELDGLLQKILLRKPLREYGMKVAEIEEFADSVIANQQRLLKNNYAPLSREEMIGIYKQLF